MTMFVELAATVAVLVGFWLILSRPYSPLYPQFSGIDAAKTRIYIRLRRAAVSVYRLVFWLLRCDGLRWMNAFFLYNGKRKYWKVIEGTGVFRYEPATVKDKLQPCLIYIHGGGFAFPHSFYYHLILEDIAKKADILVLSIDYPLAPDFPYPAGHDACYAVVKHILAQGDDLGIDVHNIQMAGDSAGSNLVLAVSIRLAKNGDSPPLKQQILVNGSYQLLSTDLPSFKEDELCSSFLTKEDLCVFMSIVIGKRLDAVPLLMRNGSPLGMHLDDSRLLYLGGDGSLPVVKPADLDDHVWRRLTDPGLFPLMNVDFPTSLAPAVVIAGTYDVLRSDSEILYKRLIKAGCAAVLRSYDTGHVGFVASQTPFGTKEDRRMYLGIVDLVLKCK